MKKVFRICGITLCSVAGGAAALLLLLAVFLSVGARVKYHEFYSLMKKEARNPGLWDNYIPQGITFNDDENYYATCGYMKDGSASRIYTVDKDTGKREVYALTSGGEPFTGHTGGLQYAGGNFYLASEQQGVFRFSADKLDGSGSAEIGPCIKVNNNSSFIFADDDFIYVGEFAHVPAYPCEHEVTFGGKTNTAILTKYSHGDLETPVAVYSIPDEVQGVALTPGGSMIFSRSWGLDFASYDVYKPGSVHATEMRMDGAPVYFLGEPDRVLKSILFTEDVDLADGRLISMTEAAANKYYVGKFIFDYSIFSIGLPELEG